MWRCCVKKLHMSVFEHLYAMSKNIFFLYVICTRNDEILEIFSYMSLQFLVPIFINFSRLSKISYMVKSSP